MIILVLDLLISSSISSFTTGSLESVYQFLYEISEKSYKVEYSYQRLTTTELL